MPEPTPSSLDGLPESLRALAEKGEPRRYRKGAVLIHEGDFGDTLYIVLSGKVKAYSVDERDREIIYGTYGPGDWFGEMSLDGGPRSASVAMIESGSCVLIPRRMLEQHIAEHPQFAFELLSRVIARARMATASARNMALLDVYGRVVHLLESLAQPLPDGSRRVSERLTHGAIAARVGCSREMVSRLLKDLERGGYIEADPDGHWLLLRRLPGHW
ncbi:Crp/Fnr family transcriptional regulator [Piscinibacter sakaiensis]|uniref:Crp/Fnr family transcriptional regulator n=1 Tax=Piscinibacter sakaiensis TaxID=1547922 RepID=UPI003AB0CAD5